MHVLSMKRRKNAIRIRANFRSQRSLFSGYAFPRTGNVIAFVDHFLLKRTFMANRGSALFTARQRTVSGLAIVFLLVAAFFGFLNSQKMKALRANTANAIAARDAAERREANEKLNAAAGGTTGAEERATKVEAELAQVQKEKADLQAKLDANQQET